MKETLKEKNRRYNRKRAAAIRAHRLMREYGITPEQYERLAMAQRGVCAICRRKESTRRLDVDHCHATGLVRGLLCRPCNHALGFMRDDPLRLEAAIAYLNAAEAKKLVL